jgi:hypothetical protein
LNALSTFYAENDDVDADPDYRPEGGGGGVKSKAKSSSPTKVQQITLPYLFNGIP